MIYYLNNLLSLLAIFTILGMSFNLLMGYGGLFSVAHGAFFGLGAYTTGILMKDYDWSFIPALLVSFLVAGVVSLLLGVAARRVTDIYLVILSLAFQVGAVELYNNVSVTGGPGGLIGIPRPDLFGIELSGPGPVIALSWAVAIIVAIGVRSVVRSPFGRTLTAVRDDDIASRSLGKPTARIKIKAFVVSSSLAGVAGSLFAVQVRYISPAEFGLDRSIEVLSLAIIGGLATLAGPFVGAIFVVLIPEAMSFLDLPDTLVGAINGFLFSLLVLLFLVFRPQGIAGGRRSRRAKRPRDAAAEPEPERPPPPARPPPDVIVKSQRNGAARESPALRCSGVSVSFGALTAVDDVTLALRPGSITGLVGPNGAGKTTLFNVLSGLLPSDRGTVHWGSEDVTSRSLDVRAQKGIVRSFQEMRIFEGMTARDNIVLAMTPTSDERILVTGRSPRQRRSDERDRIQAAAALLDHLGLGDQEDTLAGDLSYAEQKLLMIGRLLGTGAECFLLDEPMAGLDAAGRERIMALLQETVDGGKTICLVEHSLDVVRSVCSWVAFLADGKLVTEGPTDVITKDRDLAAIYFGT